MDKEKQIDNAVNEFYQKSLEESHAIECAFDNVICDQTQRTIISGLICKIIKADGEDIQSKLKLACYFVDEVKKDLYETAEHVIERDGPE